MLLDTEVSEFIIGNFVVIIFIISEDVLSHIFKFHLIFLKQSNQSSLDFFFIELLIFIGIVRNKQLINSFSNLSSEGVVRENELYFILVIAWGRAVNFKGITLIKLFIIFSDVEFISEVFQHCQEALDPVEVLIKRDKSIIIFVNLSKDFVKNVFLELI